MGVAPDAFGDGVTAMQHARRMRTDVTLIDGDGLAQPLEPGATARVLPATVERDIERENGAVAVRRQEGLCGGYAGRGGVGGRFTGQTDD